MFNRLDGALSQILVECPAFLTTFCPLVPRRTPDRPRRLIALIIRSV